MTMMKPELLTVVCVADDNAHQLALAAHFHSEFTRYEQLIIVNLVDSAPNRAESSVAEAYLHHVLRLNDERLTFVAFDFHEYWLVNVA